MGAFISDVHYGTRMLLRNPAMSAIIVCTLALGIGANSAIFSYVDAILLRPLAVRNPGELVKVNAGHKERFNQYASYPDFLDFQKETRTMAGLTAYGIRGASITLTDAPILVSVGVVAPNYFQLLGVDTALGRTFAVEADDPNHPLVAVVSYRFWQRRFDSDPSVTGRSVRLNKQPCTIVGILPASFRGIAPGENPDLWIPVRVWTQITREVQSQRGSRWLELIGRLRPGISLAQVRAEMTTLSQQLANAYPETNRNTGMMVIRESEARDPRARTMGTILLAVAGLVLLVACVNISNLLMARSEGRQREIALRLALGAGPFRIIRQLLAECLLLALFGGGLALLLAGWLIRLAPALLQSTIFTSELDIRLDGRVATFTLLISLAAVFGFGAMPALRAARLDLITVLKQQSRTMSRRFRGWTLGDTLVAAQLALSIMLLIGAGLLARTFWNIRNVDPGFRSENRLLFWLVPAALGYNADETDALYHDLLNRVRAIPGVTQATLVQRPPLYPTEGGQRYTVTIPGRALPANAEPLKIRYTVVWPDYFAVMGTTILRGHSFSGHETRTGLGSVLINEALAREFWPGQDPLGQHMQVQNKDCEIIGVVQDGKYVSLREEPDPYMYLAIPQFPSADMTLLVQTGIDPHKLISPIEGTLRNLARDLPAPEISTLDEQLQLARQDERTSAVLVGCLSGLAAFLATVGLYGLISFLVNRRTREIGIRMALGATASTILHLVIRSSLRLILAGIGAGLVAALLMTRFLASQLYGVATSDPVTYVCIALLLVIISLMACSFPARRAAKVDPMIVLRYE